MLTEQQEKFNLELEAFAKDSELKNPAVPGTIHKVLGLKCDPSGQAVNFYGTITIPKNDPENPDVPQNVMWTTNGKLDGLPQNDYDLVKSIEFKK